ncbi:MAG: DUF3857 and transglutaminase domain-containing protein [candidate division WOR-3 bacterium]
MTIYFSILFIFSFPYKILKDSIYEKYFLDGTSERYEERYVKIEDEKGIDEWKSLKISYTPYYNSSEFKIVEIIKKGGEIIKVDIENIRDELAPPELGGTIFWGTREKILELPKIETGDIIHYKTFFKGGNWLGPTGEIIYQSPFPGYFNTIELFEDYVPIKKKIYVCEELKEKPIKFKIYNGEINYKKLKIKNKILHIFWVDSVPPKKLENFSTSDYDKFRKLLITNIPDWEEISKYEYKLSEENIEPDDYIKNFTDSILKDAKSDSEKIYKLFYFVSDNIRYLGLVETDVEGYKPHKASLTLKHREGVCKDKAGLLASLLRAAGFKAYYAITGVWIKMEDFPVDQANHAIVAIEKEPFEYIYLDPTMGSGGKNLLPPSEDGQEVLVARKEGDKLRSIPFFEPEKNGIDILIEENLKDKEIKGILKIKTKRGFDQNYRGFFRDKEYKDLKRRFSGFFSFLEGFEIDTIFWIDTYDYSRYFEFEIYFKRKGEFLKSGKYILFKPILCEKRFFENFVWQWFSIEKERESPFVFIYPFCLNFKEIINSEDMKIIAFPEADSFIFYNSNKEILKFNFKNDKNSINFYLKIGIKKFEGDDYKKLYELKNTVERSFKKWVILKK